MTCFGRPRASQSQGLVLRVHSGSLSPTQPCIIGLWSHTHSGTNPSSYFLAVELWVTDLPSQGIFISKVVSLYLYFKVTKMIKLIQQAFIKNFLNARHVLSAEDYISKL